jgi:hypothetical protein
VVQVADTLSSNKRMISKGRNAKGIEKMEKAVNKRHAFERKIVITNRKSSS